MNNRIYIIKKIEPWMLDELIAFAKHTQFIIVFLREQKDFYAEGLAALQEKGIKIYTKPVSYVQLFTKSLFLLRFFLANVTKFRLDYNGVIGIKSMAWFLTLDLACFSSKSSIHAQFATQPAIIALLIKKFYKNSPKYSFTFHAYDIFFNNKWFSLLTNESQNAFSISDYNIKYVEEKYDSLDKKKILLSRLGVFKPLEKVKAKKGNKRLTIGLLSWFNEKKGIKYLLEAMKLIKDKHEIKLLLAGDGPLKNELIDYINTNQLKNSVEYIGHLTNDQKYDFFSALDIFVLPAITLSNDQDGIPVVLMEAISYGLPLISTDISGIPEICKNDCNGILIPEKNASELARAICKLMEDLPLRQHFSDNSYQVSLRYDIETNSKEKLMALNWLSQ